MKPTRTTHHPAQPANVQRREPVGRKKVAKTGKTAKAGATSAVSSSDSSFEEGEVGATAPSEERAAAPGESQLKQDPLDALRDFVSTHYPPGVDFADVYAAALSKLPKNEQRLYQVLDEINEGKTPEPKNGADQLRIEFAQHIYEQGNLADMLDTELKKNNFAKLPPAEQAVFRYLAIRNKIHGAWRTAQFSMTQATADALQRAFSQIR